MPRTYHRIVKRHRRRQRRPRKQKGGILLPSMWMADKVYTSLNPPTRKRRVYSRRR